MNHFFVIGLGGGLGSVARWLISKFLNPFVTHGFPWGTFLVNLVGCFLIGILGGVLTREGSSESTKLFWITGFLGGFTTFSTFSLESLTLLMSGESLLGLAYIGATLAGTLTAAWAGIWMTRYIL